MGAFGTSNREDRARHRRAVDWRREVRHGGETVEKVHDRRWMIALAVVVVILLLYFHVI